MGKVTAVASVAELGHIVWKHRRHFADPKRRGDAVQDLAWDTGGWAVEAGAGSAAAAMATAAVGTAAAGGSAVAASAGVAAAAPLVAATAAGMAVGQLVKRVRRRLRPVHRAGAASD
jgi:hypothetical protein